MSLILVKYSTELYLDNIGGTCSDNNEWIRRGVDWNHVTTRRQEDLQEAASPGSCWSFWIGWASASWGGFAFLRWIRCGGICPHHTLRSWRRRRRRREKGAEQLDINEVRLVLNVHGWAEAQNYKTCHFPLEAQHLLSHRRNLSKIFPQLQTHWKLGNRNQHLCSSAVDGFFWSINSAVWLEMGKS